MLSKEVQLRGKLISQRGLIAFLSPIQTDVVAHSPTRPCKVLQLLKGLDKRLLHEIDDAKKKE